MGARMLDTDQLRSFLAIVDTGSFTRAADRVHKTQSAVSMHMRRLEHLIQSLHDSPGFVKLCSWLMKTHSEFLLLHIYHQPAYVGKAL